MMLNRSFPIESLVNSSVENFKSLILPLSTISTIVPASSELRADDLDAKLEHRHICQLLGL